MNTHVRFGLLALQLALLMASVYLAWQTHKNMAKLHELQGQHHCIKAYEGMTLEPGQCAYIEIPMPGDTPAPASPLSGGDKL